LDEVRSNSNVGYRHTHHIVWCPKYRRPVISGLVDARLKEVIREVCARTGRSDRRTGDDARPRAPARVVRPQLGIHRLIKQINGRSSRSLREEFPHLRSRLPTLWTNSYFVATVGGATLEVVKRHVENQRNV
jgi:putative transposase